MFPNPKTVLEVTLKQDHQLSAFQFYYISSSASFRFRARIQNGGRCDKSSQCEDQGEPDARLLLLDPYVPPGARLVPLRAIQQAARLDAERASMAAYLSADPEKT